MRLNILKLNDYAMPRTHEGAAAVVLTAEQALRRSVLACMLWEDEFYESGVAIAGRIRELIPRVDAECVAALAVEAREQMKLRHVPLLIVREMARLKTHRGLVAETLAGHTVLLVDVSGSMEAPLSHRSEMRRTDAAYGLAILLREIAEKVTIYTFSNEAKLVAPRRGIALRDALDRSQPHGGTWLGKAIAKAEAGCRGGYDRMVVLTDEQSHDQVDAPRGRGYVVNVASNRNGVGYGAWTHVDGWSEAVVDYIAALEAEAAA